MHDLPHRKEPSAALRQMCTRSEREKICELMHGVIAMTLPLSPAVPSFLKDGNPGCKLQIPSTESERRDQEFVGILPHYRASGGIATGDELGWRAAAMRPDGIALLGRQVVAGELICFGWRGNLWFPLFQFTRFDLSLRDAPARVIAELHGVMDGWELAQWFVSGHASLGGRTPLACIDCDADAVIDSARIDRFILA